jgi:ATP-dependent Lon protease
VVEEQLDQVDQIEQDQPSRVTKKRTRRVVDDPVNLEPEEFKDEPEPSPAVEAPRLRKRLRRPVIDPHPEPEDEAEEEWCPGSPPDEDGSPSDEDGDDVIDLGDHSDPDHESEPDEEEQAGFQQMLLQALMGGIIRRKPRRKRRPNQLKTQITDPPSDMNSDPDSEYDDDDDEDKQSTLWQDQIRHSRIPEEHRDEFLKRAEELDQCIDHDHRDSKGELYLRRALAVPFGVFSAPPVASTLEQQGQLLREAKQALDDTVFGMANVKDEILNVLGQMLAQIGSAGSAVKHPKPRIFCLVSPPGHGKTLVATTGLKAVLKRPSVIFSMAGTTDVAQMFGCSLFYEGSHPGSLYDAVASAKCMDPILVFDEVDKIADNSHGRALTNSLIHLTDPLANDRIRDAYLSPLTLDLSACPMVFLCNDPTAIPPALHNRMHFIHVDPPTLKERVHIVRKFIWTQVLDELQLNQVLRSIEFTNEAVDVVLKDHTKESEGLRGVKDVLKSIALTLNRQHMMGEVKLPMARAIDAVRARELVEAVGHRGSDSSMSTSVRMMFV